MASESQGSDESVDLPPELDAWLDGRAADLGLTRTEVIEQLLASYRAADQLDDREATDLLDIEAADVVDEAVEAELDERIEQLVATRVHQHLEERLDEAVEAAVADALPDIADAVEARLDERGPDVEAELDRVESEFQEKLLDVRERVIQVKRETDAKAPADHTHEQFGEIATLHETVSDLADDFEELRERVDEEAQAREDLATDVKGRLDDAESKLNRVAWVVSDLKEEATGRGAHERAVERIKRAAAQENISTATCENCGDAVEIALLTDPQCPHCDATVSDVRPEGGFLRSKARLVTAAQLESGEEER